MHAEKNKKRGTWEQMSILWAQSFDFRAWKITIDARLLKEGKVVFKHGAVMNFMIMKFDLFFRYVRVLIVNV